MLRHPPPHVAVTHAPNTPARLPRESLFVLHYINIQPRRDPASYDSQKHATAPAIQAVKTNLPSLVAGAATPTLTVFAEHVAAHSPLPSTREIHPSVHGCGIAHIQPRRYPASSATPVFPTAHLIGIKTDSHPARGGNDYLLHLFLLLLYATLLSPWYFIGNRPHPSL